MYLGRRWIVVLLSFLGLAGASGAPFLLGLEGTLSGDLVVFEQSKASIHWTATTTALDANSDRRSISLEVTGPGVKASIEGKAHEGSGSWTIRAAEVDVARWFGPIAARYFPDLVGFQATGTVSAVGAGVFADSDYSGAVQFNLSDGTFNDLAATWSLSGLSGQLVCPAFPSLTSAPRQQLRFTELKIAGLTLSNGLIEYEAESNRRIRVHQIRLEALGGIISCGEFVVDATNSPIETRLRLQGVQLEALQSYLPKVVAEAHGRVDAEVGLRWSAEEGFAFGQGSLRLRAGENASIRLAPSPGFLSSQVPSRINLAPAWMGQLGRAFSQAFPAHQTLVAIENGEQSLVVESIEAELYPQEEAKDATALLRIVAHPTAVDKVKKVRLNIKVAGPLADVLHYGMNDRLSFGP